MNFQITAQGRTFNEARAYYTHDKPAPGRRPGGQRLVRILRRRRGWRGRRRATSPTTMRKAQKPVRAYLLAWHPNKAGTLDWAEMSRAANDSLRVLGLEKHQAVIVHRVSPEDGRMAKIDPPRVRALDRWANEYEKARGQVVSPERAAKYERVAEKQRQYPDPEARRAHAVETAAWRAQAAQERQEAASGAGHPRPCPRRGRRLRGLLSGPEPGGNPAEDQRGGEGATPAGMGGPARWLHGAEGGDLLCA